ncbi:MAG: hypothetical protein PT942_04795 [Eubacteriales bacterium]|jgi:hypothetical protein|nr:hypothetical protein [Eubacteriales bacterium]
MVELNKAKELMIKGEIVYYNNSPYIIGAMRFAMKGKQIITSVELLDKKLLDLGKRSIVVSSLNDINYTDF